MPKKSHGHGHDTRYVRLQKNFCFACGNDNLEGMRLKFAYDEERDCFVCRFRLGKRYTGPPGHCHGGVIATILQALCWGGAACLSELGVIARLPEP